MGKPSYKAIRKYDAKTYDKIIFRVRKDAAMSRAAIQAAAGRAGMSTQGYILQAIAERMERDKAEE